MEPVTLAKESLEKAVSELTLQRVGGYIGNFYDCCIDGRTITGKVKGNHGEYSVSVTIGDNGDIAAYSCLCKRSSAEFCKHAAALGITFMENPWLFHAKSIDKTEIKSFNDLRYYLSITTLKDMVSSLKTNGLNLSDLAYLLNVSVSQLSSVIKEDMAGKIHLLTEPVKLACLYLLDKNLKK